MADALTPLEMATMLDAATEVSFVGAPDGSVVWMSAGVARLLGWAPDELVGRPFLDMVHPDDRSVIPAARHVSDARMPAEFRVRLAQKGGGFRRVDITVRSRFDEQGVVCGRYGSLRDADVDAPTAGVGPPMVDRQVLDGLLDPWVLLVPVRDAGGVIVDFAYGDANEAACRYNGLDREELLGSRLLEVLPGHLSNSLMEAYVAVQETGAPLAIDDLEYPRETFDGAVRVYAIRVTKVDGGLSYTWRDVTESRVVAQAEEQFRLLATNSAEMVVLSRELRVVWASPSVLASTGASLEQIVGSDVRERVLPEDVRLLEEANTAAEMGVATVLRLRILDADGSTHWVESHVGPYVSNVEGERAVLTSSRVIDDLVAAEEEIDHRARFDVLTGLMNRSEALQQVARLTRRQPRTGDETAVAFCDVDDFKAVNDTYGHAAGDEVLRTLGERVTASIRADDFAARIGGDELLVVLTGIHSLDEAVGIAVKIGSAAAVPVPLQDGTSIPTSLSIGVTLARPGEGPDALVTRADAAMYEAKHRGRNQVIGIR